MRQLVAEGRESPLVRERARQVVSATPALHPVEAIYRHVQRMPYAFDEDIASRWGVSGTNEILQGAEFQLEKERDQGASSVEGDCDDRAILTQSMLESLGYETSFVLVRGPGRSDYSHVYSEVKLENGRTVPLDTIMDGKDGRPFFAPGQELGSDIARDRTVVPVREVSGAGLLLLAAAVWLWRAKT